MFAPLKLTPPPQFKSSYSTERCCRRSSPAGCPNPNPNPNPKPNPNPNPKPKPAGELLRQRHTGNITELVYGQNGDKSKQHLQF